MSMNQNQKKLAFALSKSHTIGPAVPCGKCERTNYTTSKCQVKTNQCMWCGSTEYLIAACPQRLRAVDKGLAKSLPSPHQGPLPPPHQGPSLARSTSVGRAYVMGKKKSPPLVR